MAGRQHTQHKGVDLCPLVCVDGVSIEVQPVNARAIPPMDIAALPQQRELSSEFKQALYLRSEIRIFLQAAPVHPADLVVLAIGIVIPLLGVPEFITGQDHWRSL